MPVVNQTVLILGSGSRESALRWAISKSELVGCCLCAPGNGGIAGEDRRAIAVDEFRVIEYACKAEEVDLVIVGPEAPLVGGIVDYLTERGIQVVGPSKAAAQLEGSKVFTKQLCAKVGIPTAPFEVFDHHLLAKMHIENLNAPPVVKADGLCGGKGVKVSHNIEEAMEVATQMLSDELFGEAGRRIVVEERLVGRECSVMAFCDGVNAVLMPPARDYKRAFDGDEGDNTGGMGAVCPVPDVDEAMLERIKKEIILPTLREMDANGTPFHGILYAGIMITDDGPMLLEYNVRFGDPEAQVVLPMIESDVVEYLIATRERGGLEKLGPLLLNEGAVVGVTVAHDGYPGPVKAGAIVHRNIIEFGAPAFFIGAAERNENGELVTTGGRVGTVVEMGDSIAEARTRVYSEIKTITFDGMRYRNDIAVGL